MAKEEKKSHRGGSKKGERRGGRKKGTPNKKSLKFAEKLQELGFDAVEEAVKLYKKTEDDGVKSNILTNFLKYLYPQRKAVDVSGDLNTAAPPIEVKFI